jgi:hypothetical protein
MATEKKRYIKNYELGKPGEEQYDAKWQLEETINRGKNKISIKSISSFN